MKKTAVFTTHSAALTGLFILGNGVIIFPAKNADEYTFLGYILAAAAAFLLYFCLIPLINKLYRADNTSALKTYKKILLAVFYFLTAVFSLWYGVEAFANFTAFASALLLQDFSNWVPVLIFLFTVIFFTSRRQEDFLKFTLLAFCFAAAVIIFFFIASLGNFKFDNIIILNVPKLSEIYPQFKEYFFNPLLPTLLIGIYEACVFEKVRPKATFWGLGLGFILLGMCILNSVLLFGPRLAAILDYPYASAVSTVTIGRLFTRLDGFSYFVYFAAGLTKICVCLFLVWAMLKKTNRLLKTKKHIN